jgi:hypothetical protein
LKTIYRIQDIEGRGPWRPVFSHKWIEVRDDHNHLIPYYSEFLDVDFSLRKKECSIGVGCRTIAQLHRWFTRNEYRALLNYGYAAVKLKADRIIAESDIQCVFAQKKPLRKNVTKFALYSE